YDVQQTLPVVVPRAGRVDVAVVVRAATFAGVRLAGRVGAHDAAVADARRGLVPQQLTGVGDAAEVDHGLLHGDFDALAAPGELALVQRGQDADRGMQAGARVADRQARLQRPPVRLAGGAHRAANRLSDHVERQELLVRTAGCEAFDLGVDDARIDPPD